MSSLDTTFQVDTLGTVVTVVAFISMSGRCRNHAYWAQTKGLYIPLEVSLYSVYNPAVFNGVYTEQGKID